MIKPDKLRKLLTDTLSHFAKNPDQLRLYYANGKIRATSAASLSFEYVYDLELTIIDFPYHPDLLFVPLQAFIREQQPDLLLNPQKSEDGIKFEVEPNNHKTHDIYVKIPLTERVVVTQEGGSYEARHAEEPQPTEWQPIENLTIYLRNLDTREFDKIYERITTPK